MDSQTPRSMAGHVLHDRTALVTGSTRGIGRAIADGFARAGARVILHGRPGEEGESLARDLDTTIVLADLLDSGDTRRLIDTVHKTVPHLDILVNNAGMERTMWFSDPDMQYFREAFRVNAEAPMEITCGLLDLLKRGAGRRPGSTASVINITSIHESTPVKGNGPYAMTKAALAMFTKTIALEWGQYGIRANAFAPGAIETDMNRELITDIGHDRFAAWIPMGRIGVDRDMVGPALFLASDASSYVTGATLTVDGGYSHHLVRYSETGIVAGKDSSIE